MRIPERVLALLLVGVWPLLQSCRPEPVDPPASEPVADRMMLDLETLAADSMAGRGAGTEGGRMAREYLVSRLREMGLQPQLDTFAVRRFDGEVEGVNVRVTVPGTTFGERFIVTTAHYDHLGVRDGLVFNGADDNASGTAGLLDLVRGWTAEPPAHSIVAVFTDAEEGGLQGARHFVGSPPMPLDDILLEVNLDMVAHSSSELWVSGTHPWPALRPLVERIDPASPVVLLFGHDTPEDQGADNWIMASDHGPFHEAGVPFLYFGVADHPDYHRSTDDVETIDPVFYRGAIETVRRVVAEADRTLAGRRPGAQP